MSNEELLEECHGHGKIMEKREPMKKDEKIRAFIAFKYTAARPEISDDDRRLLQTALRVVRIL